jgi:hypothetical protein
MTLNRFILYVEAANRIRMEDRKVMVVDTSSAIGMALSGKGMKKWLEQMDAEKNGN